MVKAVIDKPDIPLKGVNYLVNLTKSGIIETGDLFPREHQSVIVEQ